MKLLLLTSICLFYFSTSIAQTKVKIIKGSACIHGLSANLRNGPSLQESVLTNLPKYSPISILERKPQWLKVESKNFTGWVFHELVKENEKCVIVTQPGKTLENFNSSKSFSFRENVEINEGFKILDTEIGQTKVEDKFGNVFVLENNILWPKSELEELKLSI